MKKLCIVLVIMITFSLLIVGCGGSGTPADPTSQINTILDNLAAGMKAHDSNKVISCFTDPFTMSTGTSMTLAQFKVALDAQFSLINIVDYQIIERTITIVDSNNATATLKEVMTIEGSSPSTSPLEKFTFVNQGGNWKITAMGTP